MKSRIELFRYLILLPLLYIIFHLVAVTLLDPYNYCDLIKKRKKIAKNIEYYRRGDILDRNGHLLVTTLYHYQLDIDKAMVELEADKNQQKKVYEIIATLINQKKGIDKDVLIKRLRNDKYSSIFLADDLLFTDIKYIKDSLYQQLSGNSETAEIAGRVLSSLSITRTSAERIYPYENLAPRLLGMAIAPENSQITPDEKDSHIRKFLHLKGACGMEATFDDYLKGEDGWREILYDATGREIPKPFLKKKNPVNGLDVYLTLNIRYQEIMEKELKAGLEKYEAKRAMGVMMNVNTGEIYALSGMMENDSDVDIDILRSFSNLPVSYSIEPGSTMKPVTALIALEKNLFESDELIDCHTLHLDYADGTRKIADHKPFTEMNLEGIIVHSSNPGISRVAMRLGNDALYNRLIQMGLGRETLSGIYGESKGIFRPVNKWSQYSLCSIAFGQEISLNMLHLAVLYASIANQGKIVRPQILLHTKDTIGNISNEIEPQVFRTISNPEALSTMQVFLKKVVQEGTGTNTKLDYIDIAGKTGTAEVIGYDEEGKKKTYHNSVFAGYFPADSPEIVMVIAYERCKEDINLYYYASQSAVPTFCKIIRQILVLPECTLVTTSMKEASEITILPDLRGLTKAELENKLNSLGLSFEYVNEDGGNIVSDQYPQPNIHFSRNQIVKIALAENYEKELENGLLPDFSGLTLTEAYQLAKKHSVKLKASGKGIVYKQSIPSGTKMIKGAVCHLYLQ